MKIRPKIAHVAFNQALKLPILIAELRSLRAEMDLLLILPAYDQLPETLETRLEGVRICYIRLFSRQWSSVQTAPRKLLRFMEFTMKVGWRLFRERRDVWVGHDLPGMLPLLPFILFSPRRVVFAAHELWTEASENNAPLRPLWRLFERWMVRRVRLVIVPEENRARIMFEEYGAVHPPIVVRNIPANTVRLQRSQMLQAKFALDDAAVTVLYQGLLADTRCLVELADAIAWLPQHFHIVFVGEGDEQLKEKLLDAASKSNGRIHLLPWMPPDILREFTASADVGVLLYRNTGRNNYYAAPNKLYEYLFAGLPLVSSAFPGLQSVVEGGGYGVCADPEQPEDIARAIIEAAEIPAGEPVAEAAHRDFVWDNEALILKRAYYEMLESGNAF